MTFDLIRWPTWDEFLGEFIPLLDAVPNVVYIVAAVTLAAAIGAALGGPDPLTDPNPWKD